MIDIVFMLISSYCLLIGGLFYYHLSKDEMTYE